MKLLAIAGSIRAGSSNAALVRAAARLAPPGVVVEVYDGVARLPHFSPDLDVEPLPGPVAALRAAVGACNGLVIATPEYAHGMPGSLKNALDWLVSATEPIDLPVLMRLVDGGAHVFSRARLDADGELTDDALRAALRRGIARLVELAAAPPSAERA
jgi:chromate reductase